MSLAGIRWVPITAGCLNQMLVKLVAAAMISIGFVVVQIIDILCWLVLIKPTIPLIHFLSGPEPDEPDVVGVCTYLPLSVYC